MEGYERLFLTLKECCRVEALQRSSVKRIKRALAVYLVVSWHIGLLMRLGRACTNWDAKRLLAHKEWLAASVVARKTQPLDAVRGAARDCLPGGFLGRKSDGYPA